VIALSHELLVAIFAIAMLAGVAGVLIPVLPGIPLMFLVALVFGFVDRFAHLVWWELAVLFGITLASVAVDYSAGLIGARYGGAGRWATIAGMIGFIVGIFAFPPFGGLIGLFAGVLIAELLNHGEGLRSLKAATVSLLGSIAGIIANLLVAVLFLALFVFFALH
jgi:uncharacterized protein YqgC (DUF456 family)